MTTPKPDPRRFILLHSPGFEPYSLEIDPSEVYSVGEAVDGQTYVQLNGVGTFIVTETRDEVRRLMGLPDPLTLADLDAAEAAP